MRLGSSHAVVRLGLLALLLGLAAVAPRAPAVAVEAAADVERVRGGSSVDDAPVVETVGRSDRVTQGPVLADDLAPEVPNVYGLAVPAGYLPAAAVRIGSVASAPPGTTGSLRIGFVDAAGVLVEPSLRELAWDASREQEVVVQAPGAMPADGDVEWFLVVVLQAAAEQVAEPVPIRFQVATVPAPRPAGTGAAPGGPSGAAAGVTASAGGAVATRDGDRLVLVAGVATVLGATVAILAPRLGDRRRFSSRRGRDWLAGPRRLLQGEAG